MPRDWEAEGTEGATDRGAGGCTVGSATGGVWAQDRAREGRNWTGGGYLGLGCGRGWL